MQTILPETSPFLSAQMAVMSSFFQMFIVLGMYNFALPVNFSRSFMLALQFDLIDNREKLLHSRVIVTYNYLIQIFSRCGGKEKRNFYQFLDFDREQIKIRSQVKNEKKMFLGSHFRGFQESAIFKFLVQFCSVRNLCIHPQTLELCTVNAVKNTPSFITRNSIVKRN